MQEMGTLLERWRLDEAEVRRRMYRAPTPRERWHAVWLLAQGWTAAAVAQALAHNVLKMVRRLRRGVRLPGSVVPADVIATKVRQAEDDAVADFGTLSRCFAQVIWWAFHLSPALR